jgi:hypothetical protein
MREAFCKSRACRMVVAEGGASKGENGMEISVQGHFPGCK